MAEREFLGFADYPATGCVAPLRAMPGRDAADVLARLDGVKPADVAGLPHPWIYKSYLLFTWMADLVRRPSILDAVERLIGPDILVMSADIWTKAPGERRHISLHQDAGYWQLDPLDIVTAWVALTPATRANGCMTLALGTHRLGRLDHRATRAADNMLSHGQTAALDVSRWQCFENELDPGEMSLHHALLAHASGPNPTRDPRTAVCIRYLPGRVRWTGGPRISAMAVRGRHCGNLELESPPEADLSDRACRQHARVLARHEATRYVTF